MTPVPDCKPDPKSGWRSTASRCSARVGFFLGFFATIASVVSISEAMVAAFWRAKRVTFVGLRFDDAEDVVFLHDHTFPTIKLDLRAGPEGEQAPVPRRPVFLPVFDLDIL